MQIIYLILTVLGFILPYSQLTPFFIDNGFNLPLFWSQLFANQISSDFAFDLFTSSVVFWIFVFKEGTRLNLRFLWLYIVFNLVIGLSFALPLFLLVRSKAMSLGLSRHPQTKLTREAT